MTNRIAIAPSVLSADFARPSEEVAEAEAAGADRIHVDVMDGARVLVAGSAIFEDAGRVRAGMARLRASVAG